MQVFYTLLTASFLNENTKEITGWLLISKIESPGASISTITIQAFIGIMHIYQ